MDNQRSAAWEEFRRDAIATLRDDGRIGRRGEHVVAPVIHVFHYPAFTTVQTVDIYRNTRISDGDVAYRCVRGRWDQLSDQRQFSSPVDWVRAMRLKQLGELKPTIEYTKADVDLQFGHDLEERIKSVQLPVVTPRRSWGLDGETWTVRFGDFWTGAEYHWWVNCPDEWRVLGDIVDDVWRACDVNDHTG